MSEIVRQVRDLAIRGLRRMYRPQEQLFGFTIRRTRLGDVLEGVSRRYTAIALIGLSTESDQVSAEALHGQIPHEVCGHLIDGIAQSTDLGEVALTLWAARALRHPRAPDALRRLRAMEPVTGAYPTVPVAWSLTALAIDGDGAGDPALASSVAERLLAAVGEQSGLFPHWPAGVNGSILRAHVACFADLVYPIQALAYYYRATSCERALHAARGCARRICERQGSAGQWWWHYDLRTGEVVERYPVYSVHQDGMAPMALRVLQDACGEDYSAAIDRGLLWLVHPPETDAVLIDHGAGLIWRKVARREPAKLSRRAQALASRLHPSLRVPGLDLVFQPGAVDYESRPYHMGWILHAWPANRFA